CQPADHRDPDQGEEIFLRRGVLHHRVLVAEIPHRLLDRQQEEVQKRAAEGEADDHGHEKGRERPEDARPEFCQMLDQRCRAVVDVIFGAAHASPFLARGFAAAFGRGAAGDASAGLEAGLGFAVARRLPGAAVAAGAAGAAAGAGAAAAAAGGVAGVGVAAALLRAAASAAFLSASAWVAGPFGVEGFAGFHFSKLEAALSSASRPRFFLEVRDFRSSAASLTPDSRAASSIARWNSRPIARVLAVNRPSVRNMPGRSFGPTTISETIPISISSLQPMSNISVCSG